MNTFQHGVAGYAADAKTLLAWTVDQIKTEKLAGFTIQCPPPNTKHTKPYYLQNNLRFESLRDQLRLSRQIPERILEIPEGPF